MLSFLVNSEIRDSSNKVCFADHPISYVIIEALTGSTVIYQNMWVDKNDPKDGRDDDAKLASRLVMVIDLQNQNQTEIAAFNQQVVNEFGKYPFFCNGSCLGNQSEWNVRK